MQEEITKLTATESRLSDLERIVQSQAGQKSVGFTVQFSADPVSNVGVHGTFKFDRVVSNVGGGYDPHTGIFTAPVTGLYAFFLFLMAINDGDIHVAIVKEGAQLDKVFAGGPGNSYDQGSSLLSKHMSAGEQVWVVQVTHDTTVRGDTWTVFSGFLVHAD
nr:hypothetical protein BaRGS_031591 [Batillaria attramentaria]